MPQAISITDEAIDQVGEAIGCRFDDPHRREALRCTSCRDIQACPGSGKTTLVVAKLMLLAENWVWRDRGICVLSHTNVARQEVERRLAHHPIGHRVLGYPHFIGTIQRFVDKFLALPCLRSQGMEVAAVDNDRFSRRALELLPHYQTASTYLSHQRDGDQVAAALRLEGPELRLGCAPPAGLDVGEDTRTFRQLDGMKRRICAEGIFRFDDMYAYAQAYIAESPEVVDALRLRFPWVFVDEMQDTDAAQDALLRHLFGEPCVVQRFGDINQAIYGGDTLTEGQTTFPRPDRIELPDSMRFGPAIAGFGSGLTAVAPQVLRGNADVPSRRHTVFLFDEQTIESVLPAFGTLLGELYSEGVPQEFTAKAVGFRKSQSGRRADPAFPYSLADYWSAFRPEFTAKAARPSNLLGYVRRARHMTGQLRECRDGYGLVVDAVLHLLQLQGSTDESGARFTKTRLIQSLESMGDSSVIAFKEVASGLCLPGRALEPQMWSSMVESVKRVTRPWTGGQLSREAQAFLQWIEPPDEAERGAQEVPTDLVNVYRHESGVEHIDIEVTTIHAVKGETHTATLVLETFWYVHDLQEMVPFLVGATDCSSVREGAPRERMKRVYVGMTRPKELLCLAMHGDHLSTDQRTALEGLGWYVEDLGV